MSTKYILAGLFTILLAACQQPDSGQEALEKGSALSVANPQASFDKYWYQGKAELTSYSLEQARYGELHQGEAVLIFVTEDLSKSKQVKLDRPEQHRKDAVKVLKLNFAKYFNTGLYPYSLFQSTFTPVEFKKHSHSLKVTASSQEWCGHTFMQANWMGNEFKVQQNSYFESEGDKHFSVPAVLLEDEIWTRLRLDPQSLPQGRVEVLPGMIFSRLRHTPFQKSIAEATLKPNTENSAWMTYRLDYSEPKRSLVIHFQKSFPYKITGWEERYVSGFGADARELTTRATQKKRLLVDYWNKNSVADSEWRDKLGLDQ